MWWNRKQTIHTGVLDISYYRKNGEAITEFENPFEISFVRSAQLNLTLFDGSTTIPADVNTWTTENVDLNMTFITIEIKSRSSLLVYFKNIEKGTMLDVRQFNHLIIYFF